MSILLFFFIFLHLPPFFIRSYVEGNFIERSLGVHGTEYYEFEGGRYGIFLQLVTWYEADKLCPANNGTLVDYENQELAEFIGRALAESAVGFGSLWIGGRFIKGDNVTAGKWKWYKSGKVINTTLPSGTKFPMDRPPYWVDRPEVETEEDMCLATDRKLHHLPLIVPVNCQQKRPFICRMPSVLETGASVPVKPPITVGNKTFYLFQNKVTWSQALSECLILGLRLAKVTTTAEFYLIGNRMKRLRPIMENAWIGGTYTERKWKWVSSDELINVNKDSITSGQTSPWYRPDDIINDGCLLADRHVCDHFVYVEAKCDRRRPFICEQEFNDNTTKMTLIRVKNSTAWISNYVATWEKAQYMCRMCLGGELLELDDEEDDLEDMLPAIYVGMTYSVGIEVRHAWIGGYLFKNKFKWTQNASIDPGDSKVLNEKLFQGAQAGGKSGILVYCKENLDVDTFLLMYKCLNVDRENQKHFFMYGLQCDIKQHFLCQSDEDAQLDERCKGGNSADQHKTNETTGHSGG